MIIAVRFLSKRPQRSSLYLIFMTFSVGLAAAIWTRDASEGYRIAREIDAGMVHINTATIHDSAQVPHGGWKQSGFVLSFLATRKAYLQFLTPILLALVDLTESRAFGEYFSKFFFSSLICSRV